MSILSNFLDQKTIYNTSGELNIESILLLYPMKNSFHKNLLRYGEHKKTNIDDRSIQELFDYKFELIKQHELCTKLFKEIEARQSKTQ